MGRVAIANKTLLEMIEKGLTAQEICKKADINTGTLKRRLFALMTKHKKYIHIEGLERDTNTIRRKRMGILLNNRMLDELKVKDKHLQEYKAKYVDGDIIISKI